MPVLHRHRIRLAIVIAALTAAAGAAFAGPPFMTDDPEPLEVGHSEAYLFSTYDKGPGGSRQTQLPAFEFNHSPVEDVHLHLMVPYSNLYPADGNRAQHGPGDTEIGVKYRFLHESDDHPQIGIFPMIELPTGSSDKGLGAGKAWFILPLWIQKSFGDWATYGGGGRTFNNAAGMRNYNFGGWLLQRRIGEHLALGGELFVQGATSVDGKSTTLLNVGGSYNDIKACGNCSLLFRAGHSVAGETHTTAYLGLYWEWSGGPDK